MPVGAIGNNNVVMMPTGDVQQVQQRANVGRVAQVNQTPAVARAQQVRNPQQVQRMSFGTRLKAGFVRMGQAAIDAVRSCFAKVSAMNQARIDRAAFNTATKNAVEAFKGPNSTIDLRFPGTDRVIQWPGSMFADMIDSVPKNQQLDAIRNFGAHMQARLENGSRIYEALSANQTVNVPTADVQNVADFTLFMYAKATEQGDHFTNGAFNIGDPAGKIASWLDGSDENYPRGSSHLKGIQSAIITESNNRQHANVQRGIDIPVALQTGLPSNFKTICYGTITPLPGSNGARRLFLKAESFGCRINNLSSKSAEELNAGIDARPTRGFSDIKQTLGHTFSFIATRGQQGNTASRKEHFPTPLKKVLGNWREKDLPAATSVAGGLFSKILDSKCETGGFGIRQLSAKIVEVEDALRTPQARFIPVDQNKQLVEFLTDLKAALSEIPHNDRLDVRLGNEVVID